MRLSGGMGNQLHQYAYAVFLAKKTGGQPFIDKSFFNLNNNLLKITKRNYELNNFNVGANEYISFLTNYYLFNIFNKISILGYLLRKFFKIRIVNSRLAEEEMYGNDKIYYVDKVFGTISDYQLISTEIQTFFLPNPKHINLVNKITKLIVKPKSVAVHIRRTDYLNAHSNHEVLDISYYQKAMKGIKEKIKDPTFYFFGDDEIWIRENFNFLHDSKSVFINYKGLDAYLFDFFAIKYCENVITSNSTFSWWAAYLNDNKNKIIIVPGKWLKSQESNLEEIYPNNWHAI